MITYTIKGDDGEDLTTSQAACIIGCKPGQILHYIKNKTMRAKSLSDVREIITNIKENGRFCYRKKKYVKTKYGLKTSREIWEMHPHNIDLRTVRVRVSNYGGMDERLWGPKIETGRHFECRNIVCNKCSRDLNEKQFETITKNGTKHDTCNKCRGLKRVRRSAKVQVGETVIHGNSRYKVCQIIEVKGSVPLVSGHRIMENGQVLKNTVKHLVTNWRLENV